MNKKQFEEWIKEIDEHIAYSEKDRSMWEGTDVGVKILKRIKLQKKRKGFLIKYLNE